jgi:hypothetical protein
MMSLCREQVDLDEEDKLAAEVEALDADRQPYALLREVLRVAPEDRLERDVDVILQEVHELQRTVCSSYRGLCVAATEDCVPLHLAAVAYSSSVPL